MRVKIASETVWEKKRRGVGSVIEVSAEVAEQNPWMKPTDDPLKDVEPAGKATAPSSEPEGEPGETKPNKAK